ncbi:MAG: hypothetical protein JSV89_18350 [Spirochaetaceae bacterium]|nr:MAG: hypothetical protein JSV89_18350 [Spirochaetaceae bacterium]
MSIVRVLHLHVGLRFGHSPDKEICARAEGFLGEIEQGGSNRPIPLYWNFPVAPVLQTRSRTTERLLASIRRRLERGQDRVVPSGFFGVPHPLLLPEEQKRDLLWCYRNPWFPALKNLFGLSPDSVLPVLPDLLSETTDALYSRLGFNTIGVPIPLYSLSSRPFGSRRTAFKPLSIPVCTIPDSEIRILPVVVARARDVSTEAIRELLSSCGKADSLHILFDLDDPAGADNISDTAGMEKLFAMISRQRAIEFLPFSGNNQLAAPAAVNPSELLMFAEAGERTYDHSVWAQIESLRRKKRKSNLQTQQLLKTLAAAGPEAAISKSESPKQSTKGVLQITNISMAGSVTLIGAEVQATFADGRLSNLIDRGVRILPGEAARSYFTLATKKEFLQTDSAFSFEREGQVGLRSILSARIGRERRIIQVILDTYFANDQSNLTLEMTVNYPPLDDGIVPESAPLELCLCSFSDDDNLHIETEIPGRCVYLETVAARAGPVRLYGKRFTITNGSGVVVLEAAPQYGTRTEQIEFRVEKKRGRYLLWANLGGSYLPRSTMLLSGRRQFLSYSLGRAGMRNSG